MARLNIAPFNFCMEQYLNSNK